MKKLVQWSLAASCISGSVLAADSIVPSLPDMPEGFGDWRIETLLAFVSIVGLLIAAGVIYMLFRAIMKQAEAAMNMAQAMTLQAEKTSNVANALHETNAHLVTLSIDVKAKPCQDEAYIAWRKNVEGR